MAKRNKEIQKQALEQSVSGHCRSKSIGKGPNHYVLETRAQFYPT